MILTDWCLTCWVTASDGTHTRRLPLAQIVDCQLSPHHWTADVHLTTANGETLQIVGLRRHDAEELCHRLSQQQGYLHAA